MDKSADKVIKPPTETKEECAAQSRKKKKEMYDKLLIEQKLASEERKSKLKTAELEVEEIIMNGHSKQYFTNDLTREFSQELCLTAERRGLVVEHKRINKVNILILSLLLSPLEEEVNDYMDDDDDDDDESVCSICSICCLSNCRGSKRHPEHTSSLPATTLRDTEEVKLMPTALSALTVAAKNSKLCVERLSCEEIQ